MTESTTRDHSMGGEVGFFLPEPQDCVEALDDATIAELCCRQISRMDRLELVRVIVASRLPLIDDERRRHLIYYDRSTLETLVYLARRCCRNRIRHRSESAQPYRS